MWSGRGRWRWLRTPVVVRLAAPYAVGHAVWLEASRLQQALVDPWP
jgi:hypothetical protein